MKAMFYGILLVLIALIIEINVPLYRLHIKFRIKNGKELTSNLILVHSSLTEKLVYIFEKLKEHMSA